MNERAKAPWPVAERHPRVLSSRIQASTTPPVIARKAMTFRVVAQQPSPAHLVYPQRHRNNRCSQSVLPAAAKVIHALP